MKVVDVITTLSIDCSSIISFAFPSQPGKVVPPRSIVCISQRGNRGIKRASDLPRVELEPGMSGPVYFLQHLGHCPYFLVLAFF